MLNLLWLIPGIIVVGLVVREIHVFRGTYK